jgi:heme oxygenase
VEFLSQMLLVHRALERHLRRLESQGLFGKVIRDYHYRESLLTADLGHFDRSAADVHALPATRELIEHVDSAASSSDASVLGFHYVMEGSTNGAKYIARSILKAYRLNGGAGASYFDPHGELQRERWAGFKADMAQLPWTEQQVGEMTDAALEMFKGITRISNELADKKR